MVSVGKEYKGVYRGKRERDKEKWKREKIELVRKKVEGE